MRLGAGRTDACYVLFAIALAACDASEAFRSPNPSLARMLDQPRADPYKPGAMRVPPAGTMPRETNEPAWTTDNGYVQNFPFALTRDALERGQYSFAKTCATCHGDLGDGNSIVATKMELVKPPTLVGDRVRSFPVGRIYQIVREGSGLMPSYATLLSVRERWEVIAYLRALDVSQRAKVSELPENIRAELAKEAP